MLTDLICLLICRFWLFLWKIVRCSVILLLLLFIPLFCIEVSMPNQESEWSCIYVVSRFLLSMILIFDSRIVPKMWYFSFTFYCTRLQHNLKEEAYSMNQFVKYSTRFVDGVHLDHLFQFSVVLLYVFTIWLPSCDVRYDFRIETMFGSSLPPVVCRMSHLLFTLFVIVCALWCPTHIVLCFRSVFSSSCVLYIASFSGLFMFLLPRRYSLTFVQTYVITK